MMQIYISLLSEYQKTLSSSKNLSLVTMKNIFLHEKVVLWVIIINALIIFIQECNVNFAILNLLDILCTLFFVIEITTKIIHYGWRSFWLEKWNRFDFVIVLLSLPSLTEQIIPQLGSFETLQILRTLRILKFFRTFRLFPDFSTIATHFYEALKKTTGILCAFLLFVLIVSLICTSVLKNIVPEYFGNIGESVYTIFRMCTIEGWYEIPDAIAAATTYYWGIVAKIVFSFLLLMGGIIGMSLINSIFVDEMVSDNNDDIKEQLNRIEQQIKDLQNRQ